MLRSTEEASDVDPVLALEWDPLSTEYLLVLRRDSGVCLIDSDAVSVIQQFSLPSAAARLHAMRWVSSAPGMFVTGGKANQSW